MGFGQAEGNGEKGKGKELFRRGERVAIGASGGKGKLVSFLIVVQHSVDR